MRKSEKREREMFRPTIGKFSKHKITNENGQFLIDFARDKIMFNSSTYFQKKEIHTQMKLTMFLSKGMERDGELISKVIEGQIRI